MIQRKSGGKVGPERERGGSRERVWREVGPGRERWVQGESVEGGGPKEGVGGEGDKGGWWW